MNFRRAWELSRLREVHTSAGQYAVGFLLARELSPLALLGLAAAAGAGLFAFTFNTLMDFRGGQGMKTEGQGITPLSAADIRISWAYCLAGLAACFAGCFLLWRRSGHAAGALCLLAYCAVGFLYSSPTFRWKQIPGLECASNGLAHALPFLAGYLQFRAADETAILYGLSFFLFMAGFYLLHCLEDAVADREAGIRNLCARLGTRQAAELALAATVASLIGLVAAGWYTRILLLLLPFHLVAARHIVALMGTGRIRRIGRIRKVGRIYGAVFTAALLVRAILARM
jgi:4-hydroxybenzoate polyprenyltransferase